MPMLQAQAPSPRSQALKPAALLLALGAVALVATVVMKAQVPATKATAQAPKGGGGPLFVRKTAPPLPVMGFAPVRPIDVVKATYDFAAQHPEVLQYIPCFCGCGEEAGHKSNESCFIARRDKQGNVLEWDTHGFGCTICVDVARESMQMYSSGASVQSIRAAIDKKYAPTHPGTATKTPMPPAK